MSGEDAAVCYQRNSTERRDTSLTITGVMRKRRQARAVPVFEDEALGLPVTMGQARKN